LKTYLLNKIKLLSIRLNTKNISIGEKSIIDIKTKIYNNNNKLIIGDNVYLRSNAKGYHAGMPFSTTILIDKKNAICKIGNNCRINGAYIHAQKKIIIGENSVVASGVNIIDSNGHEVLSKNRTTGRDNPEKIIIGKNVWIGLNAIILKGTTIGDNSIVAAGSVVKGNIPENVVVQGNIAKVVKKIDIKQ